MNCKFCNKECKNQNSLRNHERLCKLNPNRQESFFSKYNKEREHAWNKGLTKETDKRIALLSEKAIQRYKTTGGTFKGRHHTEETKQKISLKMGNNNNGNRSKKGYYKGIWCESQYELAWVIYNLDHNIKFKRFKGYYKYILPDGSIHNYFPDFILDDGSLVEIKGYYTDLVDIKLNAVNDRKISILYKDDLKFIFDYVCSTYNVKKHLIYQLYDR